MNLDTALQIFNKLPRQPLAPSGRVPNHWHFDLRYIPLEPTPSHVVFLCQTQSSYIHTERLPLGLSTRESGIQYFPESGKEAAPEVAKALIDSFVTSFGTGKFQTKPAPAFAPWRLTTEDPSLAVAVGEEFKRLGLRDELCKIHVVTGPTLKKAEEAFARFFKSLKDQIGLTGIAAASIKTPGSIVFNLKVEPKQLRGDENMDKALAYAQRLHTARPISSAPYDSSDAGNSLIGEMETVMKLIEVKAADVARAEADAGSPESAMDYALRLEIGYSVTQDRRLSRVYLIKALSSPSATDATKSMAHALLIDWYVEASSNSIRARYIHAAAHHANQSVELSPPGPCPAVLFFAFKVFEPLSEKDLELCVQYKAVWRALEKRKEEIDREKGKTEQKRVKKPNRYRCANVGCEVQADTGKMLAQCSGQCDADKKPSYCSRECQRADWKNHKPFCRPGAPCSVIDTTPVGSAGSASKNGALSIPITGSDGNTMMVSSSTMGPEMLKEMKQYAEARGAPLNNMQGLEVELARIA